SDTHLTRRHGTLTENFQRVSEYIDTTRPDLVVNTGDLAYDVARNPGDLAFAGDLHTALPVPCRHIPGNHDIGDNPTVIGPAPSDPATGRAREHFPYGIGHKHSRLHAG